jgi:formylglycine-generating enzyme required for sulfatase activity
MPLVFLSHASPDAAAAQAVAQYLQNAGLDVWLEVNGLTIGPAWIPSLEAALEASTHFVVLVGPSGVQRWVEREVRYALVRNTEHPEYAILPLLLGPGTSEKALPLFLRQHQALRLADWRQPSPAIIQQVAAAILATPPQRVNVLAPGESPFRGLLTFETQQAHLFFGRDPDVDEVVERLSHGVRFLPIVGDSGSGKSSFVKAGLIPSLHRGRGAAAGDWRIAVMQPGDKPLEALARAVPDFKLDPTEIERSETIQIAKSHLALKDGKAPEDALLDIFSAIRIPPGSRQLLVIDQFEQLFTLVNDPSPFLDVVLRAAQHPNSTLQIVATLRLDFYQLCSKDLRVWDALRSHYLLPRLARERLRDVIIQPAKLAGMPIDSGLADAMIAEASPEPGGLALLEHALSLLWERRKGPTPISDVYKAIGRLKGAVQAHADSVLTNKLKSDAERDLARRLFLELTALGEGREDSARLVPKAKLEGLSPQASKVLSVLVEERLITLGDGKVRKEQFATIGHETLIREWPRMRDWLKKGRDDMLLGREIERDADRWNSRGPLYRGRLLTEALAWRKRVRDAVTPQVDKFLLASVRRQWLVRWGSGLAVVVLLAAVVWGNFSEEIVQRVQLRRVQWHGVRVHPKHNLPYVYIPSGSLTLVCSGNSTRCPAGELLHRVWIPKSFWIGQTEVTQKAFLALMKQPVPKQFQGDRKPMHTVSWSEANSFCQMAGLRLPTEDEWEYAALAGSRLEPRLELSDVAEDVGGLGPSEVGTRLPNQWGVFDMFGNVAEWTSSEFNSRTKVIRVEYSFSNSGSARVSYRGGAEITYRTNTLGFRCAGELR